MKRIRKILIAGIICTLAIACTKGLAFSQTQMPQQDMLPAETGEDVQPQPEVPKPIFDVRVENDLLSVELEDADFGTVIYAIAEKSGFKVEMTADVSSRKLTTKFENVEIERGVLRLLTLIKEKNYMSHYNTKGMLSKLEIYGSGPLIMTRPASPMPQPVRPQIQRPVITPPSPVISPARQPMPSVRQSSPRPRFPRRTPQPPQTVRPQIPEAPVLPDETEEEDENSIDNEDEVEVEVPATEIPYIAPQRKPAFIPPAAK